MALPSLSASEVEEGEDAAALILKHGAVVVRGVVSLATCAETRARIDERLRLANLEAFGEESTTAEFSAAGRTPEQVDAAARYFGNVTAPVHRRDLKLALNEEVGECVRQLLRACGPCIASILTADAEMCELSALVSDPGAPAQPLHPDTQTSGTRAHCGLITAFVATQDVTPEMGPTEVCARSNVAEAHRALSSVGGGGDSPGGDSPGGGEAGKLRALTAAGFPAPVPALLRAGDVLLMDSRVIHRGGANEGGKRRTLLVCTFQVPNNPAPGSTYSLLDEYAGRFRLGGFERWKDPAAATAC